ncbi:CENP-Q, a CENPA-CAD centromere complex subunit-domain-containing protein [Cladorrhinum samala]|uniref:CENP-Q, a CENPA-CAD centromere complex subunit-domain-containing protein n=1 Tax=Cladorrhinum samala TaxID=585594 RepID=A0AAV9HQW4_9PEZI|nr:CENP-Q, a CENPA-CAD centromere complex subunit-domain-containing protein [Cladorrhinum samala]
MAPDEPNQKRKRGRPAVASKKENAPRRDQQETVDGTSTTTRGRGRLGKSNASLVEEKAPPAENQSKKSTQGLGTVPNRRGRPGKKNHDAEPEEIRPQAQPKETAKLPEMLAKKRGRPARSQDAEPEASEGRPRKRVKGIAAAEVEKNQEAESNLRAKPGRKPASAPKESEGSQNQESGETNSHPRRRGRRGTQEEPSEEVEKTVNNEGEASKASTKPKGKAGRQPKEPEPTAEGPSVRRSARDRPQGDDRSSAPQTKKPENASFNTSRTEKGSQPPPSKHKRGRPSLAEVPISKVQNKPAFPAAEDPAQPKKKQSRNRPPTEDNEPASSSQPEPPKAAFPYPSLTTHTRSINRSTISSKWTPLPPNSIAQIQSLLTSSSLPVLLALRDRDSARQAQAQTILKTFTNRLHTKLVKGMPFPSSSSTYSSSSSSRPDPDFDFEKTLDSIQALERQLDPLLHSVRLLKTEKEKEEKLLEGEYKALRELESNAKAQKRGWNERIGRKRGHALVPELDKEKDGLGEEDYGAGKQQFEVMKREDGAVMMVGGVFRGLSEGDEEVEDLARQVANHMESMKGNLGQVEGLVDQIGKGKAALQGVLSKYLEVEGYESVVLG